MKNLKRFLSLALCIITVGCFSACDMKLKHPLSQIEWDLYFLRFGGVTNITMVERTEEYDKKGELRNTEEYNHLIVNANHWMGYYDERTLSVRVDNEYWVYTQNGNGKWSRRDATDDYSNSDPLGAIKIMVGSVKNYYRYLTYNSELGYYKGENIEVWSSPLSKKTTIYDVEVEFKDDELYRFMCMTDRYVEVGGDLQLEGVSRTTLFLTDYGTTEIVLPEVEE